MPKKYQLTPEHKAELKPWADRWIANAMSTAPMTDEDREICRDAVLRLYASAKLEPPKHIVFVPSPFVLAFAGGFASAICHLVSNPLQATWQATDQATWQATEQATRQATWQATEQATCQATLQATRQATDQATDQATWQATDQATRQATLQATWHSTDQATLQATLQATRQATDHATDQATLQATDQAIYQATLQATRQATWQATLQATLQATRQATDQENWYSIGDVRRIAALSNLLGLGEFGLACARNHWNMWQGGNQWSAWDSFLSFFRYIAKLPIDYSAYDAWETLALHSGPRIVHKDFCMISDRPELLMVDSENMPHNENGPFCRWRDGSALYSVHGVRVPSWLIERPEMLTAGKILTEQNAEVRRIMLSRFGEARYIEEIGAEKIHSDEYGELYRIDMRDDEPLVMVKVRNSTPEPDGTTKNYWLRVAPDLRPLGIAGAKPQKLTARNAVASTFGLYGKDYRPMIET